MVSCAAVDNRRRYWIARPQRRAFQAKLYRQSFPYRAPWYKGSRY